MDSMQSNENQDFDTSPRRLLTWACAGALGSLLGVGGVLYVAFWMPYGNPADAVPRTVEILPAPEVRLPVPAEARPPGTYAWIDRDDGIVRIPIEDAMRIVAESLPTRPGTEEALREMRQWKIPTDAGSARYPPPEE